MTVLSGCKRIKTGLKLCLTSFDSKEDILAWVNPSKLFPVGPQNHLWKEEKVPSYFNKMYLSRILPPLLSSDLYPLDLGTLKLQFRKGRKSRISPQRPCSWHWGICPWSQKNASHLSTFALVQHQRALRIPPHLDVQSSALSKTSFFSSMCNFP